ncbi:MAG: chromosome condensation regulator RCC1, partial [Bdellovibrionota bacterium]
DGANVLVPEREQSASAWTRVAAGSTHTCALQGDGTLWCWGYGGDGQLGNPATGKSLVPVPKRTMDADFGPVVLGYAHACALKTGGSLWCWAGNKDGQLGDGSTIQRFLPVREATAAADWTGFSASGGYTCAVKNDHSLWCWGKGDQGQLGSNLPTGASAPVRESTLAGDWVKTAAGGEHACAIKTDGSLWCWGRGDSGQLGDGLSTGGYPPVREATQATDWAQVSAGDFHTCAIKMGGSLWCWGANASGQFGDNSFTPSPVPVQEFTQAADWAQVSAGANHTCAVKTDNSLWCWGYGGNGRLGDNSTNTSPVPVQEFSAALDWAQVAAGSTHTCAVKTDGTLWCWGTNTFGELGNNSPSQSLVPVQEFLGDLDWSQVSTGTSATCASKADGSIWCWGTDLNGLVGDRLQYHVSPAVP